jgi:hypothetical protein
MHNTGDLTRKLDTERGEAGNGNFLSADSSDFFKCRFFVGVVSAFILGWRLGGMWAASVYFLVR